MISYAEAIRLIEETVTPLGVERCAFAECAGRILAEPLHVRCAAPRVPVAAMDGYAVCDGTTRPGEPLTVIGESRAGSGFSGTLAPGRAVRIFTGAPMPDGADRCIMQEYARRDGDQVRFTDGYGPGWHVRAAGSDFAAGDMLLAAGTRLTPRAMIAAAAADVASLTVARPARVAIIGTGDELAAPGSAHLRADAIPDSVTYGVSAMVQQAGALAVRRSIGLDDLAALEKEAGEALAEADLVIVTGGASVGERDFAKPMFAPHGLEIFFSKVAIKPGKPVWLGRAKETWVLGLPGNPTSAMVTARLILVPLLARFHGQPLASVLHWRSLPLATAMGATGTRETFVRARWDAIGLSPLGNQHSGAQHALVEADWLIRCPPDQAALDAGTPVTALPF
ncbi:MAG: molybdopterin molybdotransferase MoeA [Novosphingobium sp.]|uniref:molybdopterin molybdotransferase MoeA n=1 Tax=Novosphingobium sp. TaxID=1874826 RepID=UPI001D962534|nr:molybdopterin molybdotransferase MoeA [Novosphingobium sp.]MCB2015131.1 molybdopterin molybdotransferase MoeA [Sphingobium sp.]MCP5386855.1 molybdopterin molybdotransferase MoeA [Novosphingobium sp.]